MGGLVDSIFGKEAESKQTSQFGTQQLNLRPEDQQAIRAQQNILGGQTGQFAGLANQLAQRAALGSPQLQQNFSQFAPGQVAGTGPAQQTAGLDISGQRQLAQGQQALQNQTAAQQRDIGQQFRGQGGVSNILQAQAAQRAALQANPLAAQAAEGQLARDAQAQQAALAQGQQQIAQAGLQAQLQGLGNQAALSQQGGQLAGLQAALQAGGAGLGAQSDLLRVLGEAGALFGQRVQQQGTAQQTGGTGGLFGRVAQAAAPITPGFLTDAKLSLTGAGQAPAAQTAAQRAKAAAGS